MKNVSFLTKWSCEMAIVFHEITGKLRGCGNGNLFMLTAVGKVRKVFQSSTFL